MQTRMILNPKSNNPSFDLTRQISRINRELKKLLVEVLTSCSFILGEWVEKIRILRDHAQDADELMREPGSCSRLDAIHAAILSAKFQSLDEWNQKWHEIAKTYIDMISSDYWDGNLKCPEAIPGKGCVWHHLKPF